MRAREAGERKDAIAITEKGTTVCSKRIPSQVRVLHVFVYLSVDQINQTIKTSEGPLTVYLGRICIREQIYDDRQFVVGLCY